MEHAMRQHISFMGTETAPYSAHQGNTYQKAKAYRKTYRHQKIGTDSAQIPPLFQSNIIDISHEHENMTSATMPIIHDEENTDSVVYLSLFYNFEWRIFIDREGNMHVLSSVSNDSLISFQSISPENDLTWGYRMIDGVFESAQHPDFSCVQAIHAITDTARRFNKVSLLQPHTSLYVRYISPTGHCNVSEITFYDTEGNVINGSHIGTEGSYKDRGNSGEKAFDKDITTFYDAIESNNSWTGLDFGKERKTILYPQ